MLNVEWMDEWMDENARPFMDITVDERSLTSPDNDDDANKFEYD